MTEDNQSLTRRPSRASIGNRTDQLDLPTEDEVDDYEREATELGIYCDISATDSRPDEDDSAILPGQRRSRLQIPRTARWHDPMIAIWKHYVVLTVPHNECRDHLANERTHLSYLRTSLALSMMGVVIAQLLALQPDSSADMVLTYYALGKPLSITFQIGALLLAVIGGYRFWRQQLSMARGKALAGGWEVYSVMGLSVILSAAVFVLFLVAG